MGPEELYLRKFEFVKLTQLPNSSDMFTFGYLNHDLAKLPCVAVPNKLVRGTSVPKQLLRDHGWQSVNPVISQTESNLDRLSGSANYGFGPRYEIWGIDPGDGIREMKPKVFPLNFPETADFIDDAVLEPVEDFNRGKNAFAYFCERDMVKTDWRGRKMYKTDGEIMDEVALSGHGSGMHLFFRRPPGHSRILYAMRKSPEGVADFVTLHGAEFDKSSGIITAPKNYMGFFIGKGADFIRNLSQFYGEKLVVKERD